jgi:hypothetical protein
MISALFSASRFFGNSGYVPERKQATNEGDSIKRISPDTLYVKH